MTPDGRTIRFKHDDDGRRTDVWFATNGDNTVWGARTKTEYDNSSRIKRVYTARDSVDTTRVSDLTYSYAAPASTTTCPTAGARDSGLRWSQTDNLSGLKTSYCYDKSNRLTRASTPGADTWVYTYDVNGNRTRTTKNGTVVQTQTANTANQITGGSYAGWTYDGAANLTANPDAGNSLSYNGSNQLEGVSGSTAGSYVFAGSNQNELISQVVPGGSTFRYTWGRSDRNRLPVLESITNPNGTSYLWHDEDGTPLAIRTYNGSTAYYALDGLGSPVGLVSSAGVHMATFEYDPYGSVTISNLTNNAATNVNPYRFAGGMFDRTSTYLKFGQRFYDPSQGRFTQQDAIETLADPARANRHEYAGSNPVNNVDPMGLDTICYSGPTYHCTTTEDDLAVAAGQTPLASEALDDVCNLAGLPGLGYSALFRSPPVAFVDGLVCGLQGFADFLLD